MKALLDTNIIIHRETSRVLNENIGILFLWLEKLGYKKFIHSLTVQEINKYEDENVRKTMLAKMASYEVLQLSLPLDEKVAQISKEIDVTDNDIIDTKILNELYCGRVDLLISEDKKIHRKAEQLGVGNKVKSINAFLEWVLTENPGLQDYKVNNIRIEKFGNIPLDQPFFDSLKRDYPEFVEWYQGHYDREAYICGENNDIKAFLSLKTEFPHTENYSDITPMFVDNKKLKICTFKVVANGYKIGERFLKIAFDYAIRNKVDEIYLTVFPEDTARETLISLIKEYGFELWGKKGVNEEVYLRSMKKEFNEALPASTYPFYRKDKSIYLVTINEKYHTSLFPDSIVRTENPNNYTENKSYANAIRKYYLTRAFSERPQRGDILLFCRTAGSRYKSAITTIGVVCGLKDRFRSFDEFVAMCSRRSALTEKEMFDLWEKNPYYPPKVIDFLYIESLNKKIIVDRLAQLGFDTDLMKNGIIKISSDLFDQIIKETGISTELIVR